MKKNNIKSKQRAALYARFSPGPNQREESIVGQMRENHLYCDKNNLVVVKEYADRSLTGRTDDRPEFQQMIHDAEAGLFDCVVCYKTDRFARDRFDAAVYKNKLKKFGVRVLYSKMSIPEGPEGIILESVLEGLDEYYSKDLAQKINRGLYDNALEGKSTGGPTPFGYKIDENKHYIIDEDAAPIVQEIFLRYAKGELASAICEDLNNRGIKTARKGRFNKGSLHRMFKNEKYIGIYRHKSSDENFEDVVLFDVVPPLIDEDVFLKVQKRVQSNHRQTKRANSNSQNENSNLLYNVDFMLSGKILDLACGSHFVGDSGTSATNAVYYYYTCNNRKLRKGCKTKSLRKDFIEDLVFEQTKENILSETVIEHISTQIEKIQNEKEDKNALNMLEKQLLEVKKNLKNILKAIEAGIYTATTKDRLLQLEDQQAKLEAEILFEQRRLAAPKFTKDRVVFFLQSLLSGELNEYEMKKRILDDFVDAVVIDGHYAIISYRFNGVDNVSETDFEAMLKVADKIQNTPEEVRKCSEWWSIRNDSRTFAPLYYYDTKSERLFVCCLAA